MTVQQHLVQVTKEAAAEFFRYAATVPEEKLDWAPLELGQSVLSMCREIAATPGWGLDVMLATQRTDEERQAAFAQMQSWTTITKCQEEFEKRFALWVPYVEALPDTQLTETRWLPFNGGRDHTYLEMLEYPRWNCTYHLGQVAYIQTLYGDKELH